MEASCRIPGQGNGQMTISDSRKFGDLYNVKLSFVRRVCYAESLHSLLRHIPWVYNGLLEHTGEADFLSSR